ncbi:MAG: hypothetical protein KF729_03340 [Sandaracinaceae bacterium]|nr:hypothetical protein [Sandaracinaceae bacterium]
MRGTALGAMLLLAGGCGLTPVEVELVFPREENFLYSEFGQLLVYDVSPEERLGDCSTRLIEVESTGVGSPILSTQRRPICEFRDGGIRFPDIPAGPHAYVMLAYDDADSLLLSGCTIAEAYEGAPDVTVRLFPTAGYARATQGRTLTCGNVTQKCATGCR